MPLSTTAKALVVAALAVGAAGAIAWRMRAPHRNWNDGGGEPPGLVEHFDAPARAAAAGNGAWEALRGIEPVPSEPAVMLEARGALWLFDGQRIATYDPAKAAWTTRGATLPEKLQIGAAATFDAGSGAFYLFQGGTRAFWRYAINGDRLETLAQTPKPVGRGGYLAMESGRIYALHGAKTRDFWGYDPAKNVWTVLTRVADQMSVVACGFTSGFLVGDRGAVFTWPDHHVQRFDTTTQTWGTGTWTSMGFRPNCDGGGFGFDPETHLLWAVQGMASRTIGVYEPATKKFSFLRPRLPEAATMEGSRAAVVTVLGAKFFYVYLPRPGNTLWRIPLAKLDRLRPDSRAADVDSAYEVFHENNGSSLVRRPGPESIQGVMGALGNDFFFMRLTGVRRYDPGTDHWSEYPGWNLGKHMWEGAEGVADGADGIYYCTGRDTFFAHQVVGSGKFTELAPLPQKVGQGARLALLGDQVWALRGGKTRDFWRYDRPTNKWDVAPPLPAEAGTPGDKGSGLVAIDGALLAFPDETVWKFDPAAGQWTKFASLPYAVSWDGGMVALDAPTKQVYVARGGITRDLGRLDLATRSVAALGPEFPDVVSVEGNRMLIAEAPAVVGHAATSRPAATTRFLYLMRGHDTHELWRIPLATLKPR